MQAIKQAVTAFRDPAVQEHTAGMARESQSLSRNPPMLSVGAKRTHHQLARESRSSPGDSPQCPCSIIKT